MFFPLVLHHQSLALELAIAYTAGVHLVMDRVDVVLKRFVVIKRQSAAVVSALIFFRVGELVAT